MSNTEIICPSDILQRDLFVYDNIDDAVDELRDLAVNLNRTKLFYAWMLGKFLSNRKLSTQFNVTMADMASKLGTTRNTLYHYCTVYKMLTESEVQQLGSMGVSVNLVLELAAIERGGHKEEAEKLMELVLAGQVQEVKQLQSQFSNIIAQQARPYNLLPGAEPPEADGGVTASLASDAEEAQEAATTPGEKIIDVEEVYDDDDDAEDSPTAPDNVESQNKKDAAAMLRQARQTVVALRRELSFPDLRSMLDVLEDQHSVILGDKECSDEFEQEMVALYTQMQNCIVLLIEQVIRAVNAGYLTSQIKMPQCGKDAFNGQGLFI